MNLCMMLYLAYRKSCTVCKSHRFQISMTRIWLFCSPESVTATARPVTPVVTLSARTVLVGQSVPTVHLAGRNTQQAPTTATTRVQYNDILPYPTATTYDDCGLASGHPRRKVPPPAPEADVTAGQAKPTLP